MDYVTRIGVSVEPDLLTSFDELIERKGYATRSEAIRDLIKGMLIEETLKDDKAHTVGSITLVYDHTKGGVNEGLMAVQHKHHHIISSSIHIHLDTEKCLEVLVVHGSMKEVTKLSEAINSIKGITQGKPVLMSGEPVDHKHEHE
ncbi:MAG TPA: nickel-responsive transcriptional regulator NikR [Methanomassiliicoccales archaeon]|jgi:CopG family nickel-responsive transcriptional regulator